MFIKSEENSAFSSAVAAAVDAASVELLDDGPRSHMGASEIGHKCSRFLWYKFRWVVIEKFKARMLRLFNRGHREEPFLTKLLDIAGFDVSSNDVDGNQWGFKACDGHFGGSCDGIAQLRAESDLGRAYPQYVGLPLLIEFKTNGTGAGFTDLSIFGVKQAKPMHHAQRSVYGAGLGLTKTIYINVNKNDDDLFVEFEDIDVQFGVKLVNRANEIIRAHHAPPRIHEQPEHFDCKWCPAKTICFHSSKPLADFVPGESITPVEVERNCRSCAHASPVVNGEWHCGNFVQIIPKDFIPKGCDQWISIA